MDSSLISAVLSYLSSSFLVTTISLLASIATFYFIPTIFKPKRQNWRNAPPGPVGWPIIGNLTLFSKRFHEDLSNLSKKYGPICSLKIGLKPAIVISSPEMAFEVLKLEEASFYGRTITEAIRVVTYNAASILWIPHNPRWSVLRRIMINDILSNNSLLSFEQVREQQVRGTIKEMYSTSLTKASVNITDYIYVALANIISNLVLSKSLFDIKGEEVKELKRALWEILVTVGVINTADFIPILKPFDPHGIRRKLTDIFKPLDAFIVTLLEMRLEERKNRTDENDQNGKMDMLDRLLEYEGDSAEDESKKLPTLVIKGMIAEAFLAGTETTSATIEWGLAEILKNPNIYHKVLSELDQVVGKDRCVEESDIANMPYLQALVKELLRLHPPVPFSLARRAEEGCKINGYDVPKDCIVFHNIWGMGRDPNVWEKPLEFMPERFVGSSIDVKGLDYNLLPFGAGRRSCAGRLLALRMVQFYLASLLHAFEWEFPSGVLEDRTEVGGLTLRKGIGLVGIPKPRLPDSVYQ